MNRRKFVKLSTISSISSLIGVQAVNVKANSTQQYLDSISWSNKEIAVPYVDSNLYVERNGVGVLTEWFDNSGGHPYGPYETGIAYSPSDNDYIEAFQIGVYQWPQGSTGTLKISNNLGGIPGILYNNTTPLWVNGVIQSYGYYTNAVGHTEINSFVTAPISMNINIYDFGFYGNISDINTIIQDVIYNTNVLDTYGTFSSSVGITDNANSLYVLMSNYSTTAPAYVTVSGPNYYYQQLVGTNTSGISFGPINKLNGGTINIIVNS